MSTPTDLRAALRDACKKLHGLTPHASADENAEINAWADLADAPPTVAELLARVDAGHEVRWSDADGDEWRAIHVDSDGGSRIAIEMRSRDKQDNWWFTHYPLASDFLLPARLVEVSP